MLTTNFSKTTFTKLLAIFVMEQSLLRTSKKTDKDG